MPAPASRRQEDNRDALRPMSTDDREGAPASAELFDALSRHVERGDREGVMTQNRRHPWLVGWELVVDGQRYEGNPTHMSRAELEGAIPGSDVVVLYYPAQPETNTVYIE